MGYRLDESAWPIVVAEWQGAMTDAEFARVLAIVDGWLARRQRFGLLLDTRGGAGLSPEARGRLIKHMKENAAVTAKYLVQASVIDSVLHRTLFHAANLLFPNPFPSKVFSQPEPARAWLSQKLAEPLEPT
jgi:hypothetical protein